MSTTWETLLSHTQALPVPQRWELFRQLAGSFAEDQPDWLPAGWNQELTERCRELERDPTLLVAWTDVEQRMLERLRQHASG